MAAGLHREADEEFDNAVAYLNGETSGLGLRFSVELVETFSMLETYPRMGRRISRNLYRFSMPDWPYSVVYAIEPEGIFIFAIAHESRRRNYWRSRVRKP